MPVSVTAPRQVAAIDLNRSGSDEEGVEAFAAANACQFVSVLDTSIATQRRGYKPFDRDVERSR